MSCPRCRLLPEPIAESAEALEVPSLTPTRSSSLLLDYLFNYMYDFFAKAYEGLFGGLVQKLTLSMKREQIVRNSEK